MRFAEIAGGVVSIGMKKNVQTVAPVMVLVLLTASSTRFGVLTLMMMTTIKKLSKR